MGEVNFERKFEREESSCLIQWDTDGALAVGVTVEVSSEADVKGYKEC